jgi:hypothetical protein
MNTSTIRELALLAAGLAVTATALRTRPPDQGLLAVGVGLLAGTGAVARRGSGGSE